MQTDQSHTSEHSSSRMQRFLKSSSSGGITLMVAAALALLVANSPLSESYSQTLQVYIGGLSILQWVNDALMAFFFLMVGLEIKREVLEGQLSTWSQRVLPGAAALGGMIGPALIYFVFNHGQLGQPNGWAIPTATDIAFALGVLSLLGNRIPMTLKIFLTALAIIDDLGAIVIIALFYTSELQPLMLLAAATVVVGLIVLNRRGVNRLFPYLCLGSLLWFLVLQSGVHATLAGVVLALTIPLKNHKPSSVSIASPLHRLEQGIGPWVAFLILPIFGFANAGISLAGVSIGDLMQPVSIGITLGLFVGKQVGIFLMAVLVIRLGWAELPINASWRQLYGIALLCGIGFTMSLFIGLLAFPDSIELQHGLKIGVLCGSILSGVLGYFLLRSSIAKIPSG